MEGEFTTVVIEFYDKITPGTPFSNCMGISIIGFVIGTKNYNGLYVSQSRSSYDWQGNPMYDDRVDLFKFPLDNIWKYAGKPDLSNYLLLNGTAGGVPVNCGEQIVIAKRGGQGFYYSEKDGSTLIEKTNEFQCNGMDGLYGRLPDYSYLCNDYKTNSFTGTAGVYIKTVQGIRQFAVTAGNLSPGKHIHIMTKHGEKVLYDSAVRPDGRLVCCFWNGNEKRYFSLLNI